LYRFLYRVVRSPGPRHWCIRVLGALLVLFACTTRAGDSPPREYLDEETGATVTLDTEALVFAYQRRELAANARDYVSLQAAAVNRAGKVSYVLISYVWSTVDPRVRQEPLLNPDQLLLQADGRHRDGGGCAIGIKRPTDRLPHGPGDAAVHCRVAPSDGGGRYRDQHASL